MHAVLPLSFFFRRRHRLLFAGCIVLLSCLRRSIFRRFPLRYFTSDNPRLHRHFYEHQYLCGNAAHKQLAVYYLSVDKHRIHCDDTIIAFFFHTHTSHSSRHLLQARVSSFLIFTGKHCQIYGELRSFTKSM